MLDVGGGKRSKYRHLLPEAIDYQSINIDPDIQPTHTLAPGDPFPCSDATFDTVISLNTLEHIYDAQFILKEMHRVLKAGGEAHITVPFMFRIHGHPDDYRRATPSWWREALQQSGFSSVTVTPLVWGRYTTAASISGHRILPRLRMRLAHLKDIAYANATFKADTYSGKRGQNICNVALAHFVTARR